MMRDKNRRWLLAWFTCATAVQLLQCEVLNVAKARKFTPRNETSSVVKETRGLFSPRMDYEQWTPLGRGDPLKNDPTYDYVPPVLERVHYWIDPSLRKPDPPLPDQNQKTEILVLGVSSKKPSVGIAAADKRRDPSFDAFLKFVEPPKFNNIQNNFQRISRPTFSIPSSFFPPSPFYQNKQANANANANRAQLPGKDEQSVPQTVLVPPPVPSQKTSVPTTKSVPLRTTAVPPMRTPSSTQSVSIEEANLIFQSSSDLLNGGDWDSSSFATLADSSSVVTWKTPAPQDVVVSTENVTRRNVDFSNANYNTSFTPVNLKFTKENVSLNQIFAGEPLLVRDEDQISGPGVMYKGQVADDDMDIASTYVNIGKSEAQVDTSYGGRVSGVSIKPPKLADLSPFVMQSPYIVEPVMVNPMRPHAEALGMSPMTLQTLQTMQTMQPPPVSLPHKPSNLQSLLQKEVTESFLPTVRPSVIPTTPPTTTTTTSSSLTTDPLFKHYKQPAEPLRGPMYLIIQGHSKVKTYGPSKQIHGISVQETNEIPSDERTMKSVAFDENERRRQRGVREGRSGDLQTLSHVVQTRLGAIDFSSMMRKRDDVQDVQETELEVGYDVSAREDAEREKYYKGIVVGGVAGQMRLR